MAFQKPTNRFQARKSAVMFGLIPNGLFSVRPSGEWNRELIRADLSANDGGHSASGGCGALIDGWSS
jgi:hypothetical protein